MSLNIRYWIDSMKDHTVVDIVWIDSETLAEEITKSERLEEEILQLKKDLAITRELLDRPDAAAKYGYEECKRVLNL